MEIEVGFEMNGELIAEPTKLYQLQLTYRAEDNWRVVWTKNKLYSAFTFAKIDKDGAKRKARRKIRITLDPKTQLKGLSRHEIGAVETAWLRLELVKSSLTGQDENKDQHPIVPRIYGVKLGVDKTLGDVTYEQPMPGPRMAQLDFRPENRRLTRVMTRVAGRLAEDFPFYPFVEIEESNQSLYMQFDKPLPVGAYHGIHFRCRGEAFLPSDMGVEWEYLEDLGRGRTGWRRIKIRQTEDEGETLAYDLDRSGVLEFSLSKAPKVSSHGFWIRGRFTKPDDVPVEQLPTLPPVTHLMLNTTNALNLHTQRTERYSGLAVPNQTIQLQKKPIFIDEADSDRSIMPRVDVFDDLKVFVEEANGAIEEWLPAREGSLLTASKDDRVFVVDPVEATLTFGNGIRGRMLPAGSNNVVVDIYRVVPGTPGNVGPGEVELCEAYADSVEVSNLLPGTGGRDAETVDEIVRRAPSLLSSRDRAVTRADFEIIGKEASGEVARAACGNEVTEDGHVHVVILPRRREGEQIPDPFLSTGLRDHVSRYLKRRCLVNVEPVVRLASFMPIDVSLTLRLRPNANVLAARDQAESWAVRFLDPYEGGLDGEGWPFSGTLYSQDFARMVSDIPEVRHVVDVQLFDMSTAEPDASAGWESGEGDAEIILESHDLYVVRRIRVLTEEGVE
jgi:hypothetical protein